MKKEHALLFKAGAGAHREIMEQGFVAERVGTIVGASGGPKWLVLSHLDRVILNEIVPRLSGPVHLIGSSIGAWRMACYAQSDPLAAIERFEHAYVEQTYSEQPDVEEITTRSREVLETMLGDEGANQIVNHSVFRTTVLAVRCRGITASDNRQLLGLGLMLAATSNLFSRRMLGLFFERGVFADVRDLSPCHDLVEFPMQHVALTADNVGDAIIASGSIPMVLRGVKNIQGAKPGIYRDGGVLDYHLDIPLSRSDKLTLFPHFFGHIVPGWFDKNLSWRQAGRENTDRTILICPSPNFVSRLPNGKIPDRTDFKTMTERERIACWRQVLGQCEELGDELAEVLVTGNLAARLQPL
jgi:predicted acylesterase/phospholipase RssA